MQTRRALCSTALIVLRAHWYGACSPISENRIRRTSSALLNVTEHQRTIDVPVEKSRFRVSCEPTPRVGSIGGPSERSPLQVRKCSSQARKFMTVFRKSGAIPSSDTRGAPRTLDRSSVSRRLIKHDYSTGCICCCCQTRNMPTRRGSRAHAPPSAAPRVVV